MNWKTLAVPAFFALSIALRAEGLTIGGFTNGGRDGWTFSLGTVFPGAQGGFAIVKDSHAESGYAACLEGAFGLGGRCVAMNKAIAPGTPFIALSFKVKTSDCSALTIRLTDATGQVHQHVRKLAGVEGWQTVELRSFKGEQYSNWGGAKDGQWHDPLKDVSILIETEWLKDGLKKGKILISDISLVK